MTCTLSLISNRESRLVDAIILLDLKETTPTIMMKIAILVVVCMIGYSMCTPCTSLNDCGDTTCGGGYDLHCVDSQCICLSPATGASCHDEDDCRHADHGHEHCQFDGDKKWKCIHDSCRCIQD